MVENVKYRVAIVHNTVAPYRHPLFEKLSEDSSLDLTIYYCSRGHQVRKWEPYPRQYNYKHIFLPGITIKYISINPTVIHEIIKGRLDAIILGGWIDITMQMAFIVGSLLNIPLVFWVENIEEPRSFLGLVTRPLRMLFIRKADAIITPGELSRKYVTRMGANPMKVFVAPNIIDNRFFVYYSAKYREKREELRRAFNLNNEDRVILFAGQLIERKGIEFLIRSFGKLKKDYTNAVLVIIGSGPLKTKLELICEKSKIAGVRFIESGLKLNTLIKFYSIADIFVLPAISDRAPLVINEALACSLPVVTTSATGNSAEFITNGVNGFVITPGSVEKLYSALRKILDDDGLRKNMADNALKLLMKKASVNNAVQGFLKAIEKSIGY